ncbi:Immunoglobulin domain and leucine-rich repeat-containing protein 2 [Armadillidium vulgare]|nr:Immunoglobulin domain and leucine-rich repeat-containing protein 2 [Armadillidium vulgare]
MKTEQLLQLLVVVMAGSAAWKLVLLFLFVTDVLAVVGPGDGVSFTERNRELPESCPLNCFCSGHDTRCDQWPSSQGIVDYKNFVLPRRIRNLSFKFLPNIQINGELFEQFDELQWLQIKNGKLKELPDFPSLITLSYLDLSINKLRYLPPQAFKNTPHIVYLNISTNELTNLSSNSFEGLNDLKQLDLSRNPSILQLSSNFFSNTKNIQLLDLSATNIDAFQEQWASETEGCNNLQILDLRKTNLTNVNEGVLKIDLSNNPYLWRIEHGAFSNLKALLVLRLNNCPKLYDVEEEALNGLSSLQELHFQNSGIKVLPYSITKLKSLALLNIEGNSLFCNCYAHWLPNYLIESENNSKWKGIDKINCIDGKTRTPQEIAINIEKLGCSEVKSYTESNQWVLAHSGQSALLECNVTGNPQPKIIWQTADHHLHVYDKSMGLSPWMGHQITEAITVAKSESEGKFQVLRSGQLLIKNVNRGDVGRYRCFAFNPVSNSSVVTFLGLDDAAFRAFIIESILFGFACAALFLFTTLLVQFIKYIMNRLGWECCCCKNRISPKAKQIRQLIESVESYKSAQLEKLRENYAGQVANIKDSCYQQMERLRDSYAQQSKNLKELCDYSTQQITGARDQKFSGHQLLRLRETYKFQQKTLNKLLETLPDLYIQNCRTGSCQRSDSIIFDELDGIDVYYKIDFLDAQSVSSDYFTPNSTLTRTHKSTKGTHSRDQSSISGGTEYHDVHSYVTRQESSESEKSRDNLKQHSRSFSIATPQSLLQRLESSRSHRRSVSVSSHPSPSLYHPTPPLVEENLDSISRASTTNSKDTSLYTPLDSTPVRNSQPTIEQDPIPGTSAIRTQEDSPSKCFEPNDNTKIEVQKRQTNCDMVLDTEKTCDSDVCKITMPAYETNL